MSIRFFLFWQFARNKYEVIVFNSINEERKEYVPLLKEIDTDRQLLYKSDDGEVNITVYPRLNCYNHDDPKLIRALQEKIIHPPSKLGKRQHVNICILLIIEYQDFSERNVPFHKRQSQFQQDVFLDQVIFQGRVKDGIFIEAGADDFLDGTNTLMFEEKYNWTGLLVEPNPVRFHLG